MRNSTRASKSSFSSHLGFCMHLSESDSDGTDENTLHCQIAALPGRCLSPLGLTLLPSLPPELLSRCAGWPLAESAAPFRAQAGNGRRGVSVTKLTRRKDLIWHESRCWMVSVIPVENDRGMRLNKQSAPITTWTCSSLTDHCGCATRLQRPHWGKKATVICSLHDGQATARLGQNGH